MLVNNPQKGLRLIDLVSFDNTTENPFNYSKIYTIVGTYLSENGIQQFFKESEFSSEFKNFVERFCDRFYERTINYDTYYEFVIKLKDLLNYNKSMLNNYYKTTLYEIDPLNEIEKRIIHGEKSNTQKDNEKNVTGSFKTNDIQDGYSTATNQEQNERDNNSTTTYGKTTKTTDAFSDSPSNIQNVNNVLNSNTYVTNLRNTQENNSGNDKTTTSENNQSSSNSSNTSNSTLERTGENNDNERNNETINFEENYETIEKGNLTNNIELLRRFSELNFNLVSKILDLIEEGHLFSTILY